MPNLNAFKKQSVSFTDYFNHTAATYKGIRGQLYSAFQYYDGSENSPSAKEIKEKLDTPLIGLPSILSDNGYATQFINPEPNHAQFAPYLENLGFDSVISGKESQWTGTGDSAYLSDQDNLNLILDRAKTLEKNDQPFLIGSYTFQTHNGWDVSTNKYQDGSNALLNRFHNLDTVFGEFLDQFMSSSLRDDTTLIVTTDHATYPSPDYASTFADKRGIFISTIPLMIYYPGVTAKTVDGNGRNSLALTPTILDLLDIQDPKNYFLGTSLFSNNPTQYEYISEIGESFYTTANSEAQFLPESEDALKKKIMAFNSISLNIDD